MSVATLKAGKSWTEDRIMSLTRDEVIELWRQAPAVEMAELYGEFKGLIPNAGDVERQKATAEVMYNIDGPLGYWLGKAFSPLSHRHGDGYNLWRRADGTVQRWMRFGTEMGDSLIDGRPALIMRYGAYKHHLIPEGSSNELVDEIRKLTDGFYLGVGTTPKKGGGRSEPGHFVLAGPTGKFLAPDDATRELI